MNWVLRKAVHDTLRKAARLYRIQRNMLRYLKGQTPVGQ